MEHLATQLSTAQAAADASAASAQSAQNQCLSLMKELDEKNSSIKERQDQVVRLGQQLDVLQNDLEARELSQKQLKDEVVMHAIVKTGDRKDTGLMKILEEVSPKIIGNMNKHLNVKDDEIARLRGEISFLTSHWKHKTKDLESQIEKHRRTEEEDTKAGILSPRCQRSDKKTSKDG